MTVAYFRSLAARFFHRSQTENDLEEELRLHIELRTGELERSGLGRAEAERRARNIFNWWEFRCCAASGRVSVMSKITSRDSIRSLPDGSLWNSSSPASGSCTRTVSIWWRFSR